jgi:uncharacterized protein (TIGR02611 family)
MVNEILRLARRLVVAVVGSTVLLVGVVMIVLPGPALIVIPAGLAILGAEFVWARRLLRRLRAMSDGVVEHSGPARPLLRRLRAMVERVLKPKKTARAPAAPSGEHPPS